MNSSKKYIKLSKADRNVNLKILGTEISLYEAEGAGIRKDITIRILEKGFSGIILSIHNTKVFIDFHLADLIYVTSEK